MPTAKRCCVCIRAKRISFDRAWAPGSAMASDARTRICPPSSRSHLRGGHGGVQNYGSAFLPAIHQGTAIGSAEIPISKAVISNLGNERIGPALQRKQLDLIQSLNTHHLREVTADQNVEGLIANYELAFRMQSAMPRIMGIDDETQETLDLYGVGEEPTDNFGRQCLLARRFAESGVRYIQVSTNYTWDHHQKVQSGHVAEAAKVDRPIAGLLEDLARRGLLDDTLVLWGSRVWADSDGRKRRRPQSPSTGVHDVDGRWRSARRPNVRRD